MQLLLQPAGAGTPREHYRDTVENLVPINQISTYVTDSATLKLLGNSELTAFGVWGIRPGQSDKSSKLWRRLEPGTVAAFTGNKKLYGTGVIVARCHSESLAEALWQRDETSGQTWEYAYFMRDIRSHNLPYAEMNRLLGYKPNFVPQGALIVDSSKYNPAELIEALAIEAPEYSSTAPIEIGELDPPAVRKARGEQAKLRKLLIDNQKSQSCALCDRSFPVEFLVAAHVKKRASCSDNEKKDLPNIAALMCHFGCDRLYEFGFVTIGPSGALSLSPRTDQLIVVEPALAPDIDRLRGRSSSWWNPKREDYCSWHRANVFH